MRISDWSSDVCSSDLFPSVTIEAGTKSLSGLTWPAADTSSLTASRWMKSRRPPSIGRVRSPERRPKPSRLFAPGLEPDLGELHQLQPDESPALGEASVTVAGWAIREVVGAGQRFDDESERALSLLRDRQSPRL